MSPPRLQPSARRGLERLLALAQADVENAEPGDFTDEEREAFDDALLFARRLIADHDRATAHRRPTRAQARMLADARDHGDPWMRIAGMSAHGGATATLEVCQRENWLTYDLESGVWTVTDSGIAALARAEKR